MRAAPDPVHAPPSRVMAAAQRAGVTPPPDAAVQTYRASAAVPSRTSFHLLTRRGGDITVVREAPGQPTTARTVVRK